MPPDESVGPIWLGVSSSLLVALLVTTALRLWARAGRRNLGWDDYTIAAAALSATVRYAFGVMQLPHGNGRHRVYLTNHEYMMINMYGWWGQLFHFTSMAFLKVSLALLILRIKSNRTLKILLYAVIVGSLIINFGVVIILLAECRPAGFWRGKDSDCWPNTIRIYAIWVSIGTICPLTRALTPFPVQKRLSLSYLALLTDLVVAYSVVTDFFCSLLPLTVVWKVKIALQRKIMITGLMSLGLVATSFGIVRAKSLGVSEADLSWDFCITAIWSNLELFLGISAANIALSRAVYTYFFSPSSESRPSDHSGPSSNGYFHSGLRSDRFEIPATMVSSGRRRGSATRSSNSDIPLEPGIQKKTEFWWREDGSPQRTPESVQ
ncbi:Integral membrane protein [Colletotrichum higginsianum IMI 349063]|uniref:Integral membrane protein n=1 Tax=Colletotrichum higginsianum (strain IMI 349063) TaxID=759273 RepID=A0A1B7Y8Y9_COLHI|nr:Integral membrane protein [Colletotrichum higginsianum IMI 349063]OBR08395.1 Integral membrane protein [Colletotrichum higginsianum IMI 349063]